MRQSFWIALIVSFLSLPAASTAAQPLIHSLRNPADSMKVQQVVESFFNLAIGKAIPADSIDNYAVDDFAKVVEKLGDETMWAEGTRYSIERVVAADDGDQAVIVSAVTIKDSLPMFGPFAVDWTFYMRRNDQQEWRIGMMRRMSGTDGTIQTLQYLDTSTIYPAVLKREIVREKSAILLSNSQLRQHLAANRAGFQKLLDEFTGKGPLKILGRIDKSVTQLNQHGIYWGEAAEEVPQEAIDDFMKNATPEQRKEMERRLRVVENIRRQGNDTLTKLAKKDGVSMKRIGNIVTAMKDLRIVFVNAKLPWRDAVQFTVAGEMGNALGYIYSPHGELPIINPNEYFYLEDLGNGWWLFRST
jgi:hypothetical protein